MLVILNGSETINKRWWAKKILSAMNTFEIDGYTIDYRSDRFKVYDQENTLVYQLHDSQNTGYPLLPDILAVQNTGDDPKTGTTRPDINPPYTHHVGPGGHFHNPNNEPVYTSPLPPMPRNTLDKIHYTYRSVFLDGVSRNHFQNYFLDLNYDFGITPRNSLPEWETKAKEYHSFNGYNDILHNYQNRPTPVHVITGNFSRRVMQQLKADIEEPVKVINFIRHPSVAFVLHQKPTDYYTKVPSMTPDIDEHKIMESTGNMYNLTRFKDIQQVRYEDVLRDGYFMFEGVKIEMPEQYQVYNRWMTKWEHGHFNRHIINSWRLSEANEFLCNGGIREEAMQHGLTDFPVNLFTALGYEGPLQRAQIGSPDHA